MYPFDVLMVFVVFLPILFLAYVTTKFVGRKSAKAMKGKNINIIETVSLGSDKRLHLVKAGDKYLLISSSSKSVEFLTEVIPADTSEIVSETPEEPFDFRKLFDRYLQLYKTRKIIKPDDNSSEGSERSELSFKRNLSRLKTITGSMDGQGQQNGDE